VAVRAISAAQHGLLLALDNQYLFKDEDYLSAGLEYDYDNTLFVRLGYKTGFGNSNLGGVKGVCGGIGFKLTNFAFDYAIVPYGDLGITHRAMLTYVFGSQAAVNAAAVKAFEEKPAGTKPAAKSAAKAQGAAKTTAVAVKKAKTSELPPLPAGKKANLISEGLALEKEGKTALAIGKYEAAIAADSKNAKAWNSLGRLYVKTGDKQNAIKSYEVYLQLNPADEKTSTWLERYKK
jgi:tetratricopeptide (TPR) repeat protein